MIPVIIDRSRWSRGNTSGENKLCLRKIDAKRCTRYEPNPTCLPGNMCCLGFASLVLGANHRQILGKTMPHEVKKDLPGLNDGPKSEWVVVTRRDTKFASKAAGINDDIKMTDKVREKRLKALAARHGFKFVFVGKTPKKYEDTNRSNTKGH